LIPASLISISPDDPPTERLPQRWRRENNG